MREDILNDEYVRPNDPRRSGSSVREAERRSLFHSIHAGTNIWAGVEHLCQDAKGRQRTSKSLALISTFGHPSE